MALFEERSITILLNRTLKTHVRHCKKEEVLSVAREIPLSSATEAGLDPVGIRLRGVGVFSGFHHG